MLFEGLDLEMDHHKHRPNQAAKMLFQKQMTYTNLENFG